MKNITFCLTAFFAVVFAYMSCTTKDDPPVPYHPSSSSTSGTSSSSASGSTATTATTSSSGSTASSGSTSGTSSTSSSASSSSTAPANWGTFTIDTFSYNLGFGFCGIDSNLAPYYGLSGGKTDNSGTILIFISETAVPTSNKTYSIISPATSGTLGTAEALISMKTTNGNWSSQTGGSLVLTVTGGQVSATFNNVNFQLDQPSGSPSVIKTGSGTVNCQ